MGAALTVSISLLSSKVSLESIGQEVGRENGHMGQEQAGTYKDKLKPVLVFTASDLSGMSIPLEKLGPSS